jgi:hypothetical protein
MKAGRMTATQKLRLSFSPLVFLVSNLSLVRNLSRKLLKTKSAVEESQVFHKLPKDSFICGVKNAHL